MPETPTASGSAPVPPTSSVTTSATSAHIASASIST